MAISAHDIARIVAEVAPAGRLEAVDPMISGASSVVEVRFGVGQRLVIKSFSVEHPWQLHHERFVYELIRTNTTVPVPDVIRCDDTQQLVPFDYMVMSRLPGAPIVALIELSRTEVADLYRQLGAILRALHTVSFEHHGFITPSGVDPPLTNDQFMTQRFHAQLGVFADTGGDPRIADQIERAVAASQRLFEASRQGVLCHNDLHEANALADQRRGRWQVSGVIDVGGAVAADPLFDLARTHFWSTKGDRWKQEALLAGYEPTRPERDEALHIYTLHHALELRNWFARHDRPPMCKHLDDELERLTRSTTRTRARDR
jgi:hygromycin-B 7''-O-kinase